MLFSTGKSFGDCFQFFVSSPFYFLLVYFNNQKSLWLATEHLQQPLLILVSSRNTKQTFLPHHGKEWIVGKAAQSCTWGDPLRWNGEPLNPPNKANYLKTQKEKDITGSKSEGILDEARGFDNNFKDLLGSSLLVRAFFSVLCSQGNFHVEKAIKKAEPLNCIQLCCSCLVQIETRNFGS